MQSLKAVPHLSHLMGLASPQMSTPIALRGPCNWEDGSGVPANEATSLVSALHAHAHDCIAAYCVCVCVCVHTYAVIYMCGVIYKVNCPLGP